MELDALLNFVKELLHTDVIVFQNGEYLFVDKDQGSVHQIVLDKDLKKRLIELSTIDEPLIFEWNYKYIFSLIPYINNKIIIVGPMYLDNSEKLNNRYNGEEIITYSDIYKTTFKSLSLNILLINDFVGNKHMSRRELYAKTFIDKEKEIQIENKVTRIIYRGIENESGHHSYDRVAHLENCVRNGYVDSVYQACEENLASGHGRTSDDDFENSKTMAIVGITIITRAAISGGVNYELAYSLSDAYIQEINKVKKTDELNNIYFQAALNFTQLVAENKTNAKKDDENDYYSGKVKKYINQHISSPIKVSDIAEYLQITPNYLSAIFKKNTGMNILEYINKTKIKLAKRLLRYSKLEQSQIAFNLGYASQSHFCLMFKKETGMTPKQYINNIEKIGD